MGNELGMAVRRHRHARGLTGTELAASVGVRQGTVSKIERGRLIPDLDFLSKLSQVLRLTRSDAHELMRLAGVVPTGVAPERMLQYLPVDFISADWSERRQETIAAAESRSMSFSVFNPFLVPGLLQTRAYAEQVLRTAGVEGPVHLQRAVSTRLKRQEVLRRQGRSITFLMTEGAVTSPVISAEVLAEQIERLFRLSERWGNESRLSLGLIPASTKLSVLPPPAFYLFEQKVYVELPHGDLWLRERSNAVGEYRRLYRRLRESAVFGAECRTLLERLRSSQREESLRRRG